MKKTKTNKKTISTYYHHLRPQNLLDYHANAIFSYQHPFVLHLHRAKLCCSFFRQITNSCRFTHEIIEKNRAGRYGCCFSEKKNQMMKRKQGKQGEKKLTEKLIDWFCILLMTISGIFGFCRTKKFRSKEESINRRYNRIIKFHQTTTTTKNLRNKIIQTNG